MDLQSWLFSGLILWLGASLFLTFGIVIAQFKDAQKASSFANILNLSLAIIGGLWFPVNTFPEWLQNISTKTPTYHLKLIAYDLGKGEGVNLESFGVLIIYSIIFLGIALYINKKEMWNNYEKRGWGVRLGEISTLIYLLFPFLSIFDEKEGFK